MKAKIVVSTRLHYIEEGSRWGYHPYQYKPICVVENLFVESDIMQYLHKREERKLGKWDYLDRDYIYTFKFPLKEKRKVLQSILDCQIKADKDFRIVIK